MLVRAIFRSLLLVAPILGLAQPAWTEELAVIVNAKNPAATLTREEVKIYFLKERPIWPNGEKVRSVDSLVSTPERKAFLGSILQLSSDQLEKYWVGARYSSGVALPPKVPSDKDMIEYVVSYDGAIGYVNVKSIAPDVRSKLKIVHTLPIP